MWSRGTGGAESPKRALQTPQQEWPAGVLFPYVWSLVMSRKNRELGWFNMAEMGHEPLPIEWAVPDRASFLDPGLVPRCSHEALCPTPDS